MMVQLLYRKKIEAKKQAEQAARKKRWAEIDARENEQKKLWSNSEEAQLQRMETAKRRSEKEKLTQQREEERLKILSEHVNLIAQSNDIAAQVLKEKILALKCFPATQFKDGTEKNLPIFLDKSLFNVVLENKEFTNKDKIELINYMFENLGYDFYKNIILTQPALLDLVLQIPEFNDHLIKIYTSGISIDNEQIIWENLLKEKKYGNPLFDFISQSYDFERLLNFVNYWMNSMTSQIDVIALYNNIKKCDDPCLRNQTLILKKMAQLRILKIEFNNKQHFHAKKIEIFLSPNKFNFFSRNPSCLDIYKMISKDKQNAAKKFLEKKARLEHRINEEIFEHTEELSSFQLR